MCFRISVLHQRVPLCVCVLCIQLPLNYNHYTSLDQQVPQLPHKLTIKVSPLLLLCIQPHVSIHSPSYPHTCRSSYTLPVSSEHTSQSHPPTTCRGLQAQRFYPQCTRTIVCITCVVISLSLPVSVPDGNGFPATTRVSNVRDGRSDHYLTFTISGPTVMGWVVKFRCSKPVHNLNVSHRASPWRHVTFVPALRSLRSTSETNARDV